MPLCNAVILLLNSFVKLYHPGIQGLKSSTAVGLVAMF
jgi:hypothetical protein